jgi:hypothetical protein
MPKKGNINLTNQQWTTIGRQCYVFGRKKAPSKAEVFFSPMEIAGAANHDFDGINGTGPSGMAFPTTLKIYRDRFTSKDPVLSPGNFDPVASQLSDGLYGQDAMSHACKAYEAWTTWEFKSRGTVSAAQDYDWPDGKTFLRCWRECYTFCHYFISYNPFWPNRGEAYAACKEEYI